MGLDVYLYHSSDKVKSDAEKAAFEKADNILRKAMLGDEYKWDSPEYKAYEAKKEELAAQHNCTGEYDEHALVSKVQEDSVLDPDHYFKIGYFRSSYNSGGINSYLQRIGVPDLYDIFLPEERYEFTPDWEACLERVNEAIKKYEAHNKTSLANLDVLTIRHKEYGVPVKSPQEALNRIGEELKKARPGWRSYSSAEGEYYLDGIEVVGFIPGEDNIMPGEHVTYVVFKTCKEDDKDWYLTALKIVRETIQWVLAKPDPQNYYLHWSS